MMKLQSVVILLVFVCLVSGFVGYTVGSKTNTTSGIASSTTSSTTPDITSNTTSQTETPSGYEGSWQNGNGLNINLHAGGTGSVGGGVWIALDIKWRQDGDTITFLDWYERTAYGFKSGKLSADGQILTVSDGGYRPETLTRAR